MRFLLATLIALPMFAQTYASHPRLLLTPTVISELRTIVATADPNDKAYQAWLTMKAGADAAVAGEIYHFPIVSISNSNPAIVTVTHLHGANLPQVGWQAGTYLYFGGGTGAWAAMNSDISPSANKYSGVPTTGTWISSNSFSIPFDTTTWGSYSGQNVRWFSRSNNPSGFTTFAWEGISWMFAAQNLGLAYQVYKVSNPTLAATYAAKAMELLDAMNVAYVSAEMNPAMLDSGFEARFVLPALSLIYDWCWDYSGMTTARKDATEVAALVAWDYAYTKKYFYNASGVQGLSFTHNYLPVEGFGSIGLAMGDRNSSLDLVDRYWKARWDTEFVALMIPGTGDLAGYFYNEGSSYSQNSFSRFLKYGIMRLTAKNDSTAVITEFARQGLYSKFYALTPPRTMFWTSGEGGNNVGCVGQVDSIMFPYLLKDTSDAAYAQWYVENTSWSDNNCSQKPEDLYVVLYHRSRTSTDMNPVVGQRLSPGSDAAYTWKSDSSVNAKAFRFVPRSKGYGGHDIQTVSGTVDLARGNDWVLPYTGSWGSGNPTTPGFGYGPINHWDANRLTFCDGNTYIAYGCGARSFWSSPSHAIPTSKLGTTYSFVQQDMTGQYEPDAYNVNPTLRTIRNHTRSIIDFHNGAAFVIDRLKRLSVNVNYTAWLDWHSNEYGTTPSPTGAAWTSTLNTSKLWANTLAPTAMTTAVAALSDPVKVYANRVRVTDSAQGLTWNPITALYAGASTETVTYPSVTTDANHYGMAQIVNSTPYVVVYSIVMSEQSDTYKTQLITTYSNPSFSFTSSGTGSCVVLDVSQGVYNYTLGGTVQGSLTVASDHTAYFPCAGGSWALVRTGSATKAFVNDTVLTGGVKDVYYKVPILVNGGVEPITFAVTSGSIPTGITLATNGILDGTLGASGNFSFTITATDAASTTVSKAFTWAITSSMVRITNSTLGSGYKGTAFVSQSVTASGGMEPYGYSVTSGALPTGLTLDASTGAVSGTPTVAGDFTFGITVTDSTSTPQTTVQMYTISIGDSPLAITTSSIAAPSEGLLYTASLSYEKGLAPYSCAVTAGALPTGISQVSTTCAFKGVANTAGQAYSFTVTLYEGSANRATATHTYSGTVGAAPSVVITTANPLPRAQPGDAYSQQLAATGCTGCVWSIDTTNSAGPLPSAGGVTMSSSGLISGTWTLVEAYYDFLVVATSGSTTYTKRFQIDVSYAVSVRWGEDTNYIISLPPTTGFGYYNNNAGNFNCNPASSQFGTNIYPCASGGSGFPLYGYTNFYHWSILNDGNNTLAAGCILQGFSGYPAIRLDYGCPNAGTYHATFQACDQVGTCASRLITFVIGSPAPDPLSVTTSSPLPGGTQNQVPAYSQQIAATGGTAPYTWDVSAGTLPTGITFSSSGVLAGTPTNYGTFNFTARATDSLAATATKTFAITITQATVNPVVIGTPTLPNGRVSFQYSQQVCATNGTQPYSWAISAGALPAGVTLSLSGTPCAVITGTPSAEETATFTVQATDAVAATATKEFTITVDPAPITLQVIPVYPSVTWGVAVSQAAVTAIGGTPPYTFSASGLPSGMSLSSTGVLSGTLYVDPDIFSGMYTISTTVTDSASPASVSTSSSVLQVVTPARTLQLQVQEIRSSSVSFKMGKAGQASGTQCYLYLYGAGGQLANQTSITPLLSQSNLIITGLQPGSGYYATVVCKNNKSAVVSFSTTTDTARSTNRSWRVKVPAWISGASKAAVYIDGASTPTATGNCSGSSCIVSTILTVGTAHNYKTCILTSGDVVLTCGRTTDFIH